MFLGLQLICVSIWILSGTIVKTMYGDLPSDIVWGVGMFLSGGTSGYKLASLRG